MTHDLDPRPADPLVIAGTTYRSRLLTGTGKFKDLDDQTQWKRVQLLKVIFCVSQWGESFPAVLQ